MVMTHAESSGKLCDVRLAYDDDGPRDAPVLVFIHGWTADRHRWDRQFKHFATNFRVVRVDLRGHGESVAPPGGYTIPGLADDVLALVDALGIVEFTPVGHSMGGMVALTLALRTPHRIRRFVLVDSVAKFLYSPARTLLVKISLLLPYRLFVRANISRAFGPEFPRPAVRRYVEAATRNPPHVVMACFRAMEAFDVLGRLQDIHVPVLVLQGRHDIQFPPQQALRMVAALPDATLRLLPGGHETPIESPDEVTRAIAAFLA